MLRIQNCFKTELESVLISDIDDCKENECQNGGLCVDALMSYSCSCKDGFEGRFCEKGLSNLISVLPNISFLGKILDDWKRSQIKTVLKDMAN